tara:strand:+ start:1133 stop:1942 length:810 start_codon:yes stop_codon:yes gene_type:complete
MKKKILLIGKRSILAKKIKKKLNKSFLVKHISFANFKKINKKKLKSFYLLINCSFNKNLHSIRNNPDIFIAKKVKDISIKYIMFSTSKVYGANSSKKTFAENDKCNPTTKYGQVRFKTENILKKLLSNRLLILRISNILIFDLRSNKTSKNFINEMLNSLKEKFLITIPKKKIVKDFITIEFLIECILKLIKKNASGVFNISSSYGLSLREIGILLIKGFNAGEINYSNGYSDSFILSNKKLFKMTGKYTSLLTLKKYILNLGNKLAND